MTQCPDPNCLECRLRRVIQTEPEGFDPAGALVALSGIVANICSTSIKPERTVEIFFDQVRELLPSYEAARAKAMGLQQ